MLEAVTFHLGWSHGLGAPWSGIAILAGFVVLWKVMGRKR